jgi:hypothetical protein
MKTFFAMVFSLGQLLPTQSQSQNPSSLLEEGFAQESDSLLDRFLLGWQNALPPLASQSIERLPGDSRTVYEVYSAFLSTHLPDTVFQYYVLQNKLYFKICDSVDERPQFTIEHCDSITDFSPTVSWLQGKALFLSKEYYAEVYGFIGQGISKPSAGHGFSGGELKRRLEFLSRRLFPVEGHWGGYWSFITGPFVHLIYLSRDHMHAAVMYADFDYSWSICKMACTPHRLDHRV